MEADLDSGPSGSKDGEVDRDDAGDGGASAGEDAGAGMEVDSGVDPGVDAGVDPGVDAGVDPEMDAGVDPEMDAGVDPEMDAGVDPGMDAGIDPGMDAGVDPGMDAGVDPGMDAGVDSGPENTAPIAHTQTVETHAGVPVSVTLMGSDADGDSLTYSVVSPPRHGNLSGVPPDLTYTPDAGFSGSDNFSFIVNDGTTDSTPALVEIEVRSTPLHTISGTITGHWWYPGSELVLMNNGIDQLIPTSNSFVFDMEVADQDPYHITLEEDPSQQLCTVLNGSGIVDGADVDDVRVHCRAWHDGVRVTDGAGIWRQRAPSIGVDHAGDAIAVWQQISSQAGAYCRPHWRIFGGRYSRSEDDWGASVQINDTTSSTSAIDPRVAVSARGEAIAIWQQADGSCHTTNPDDHLFYSHYSRRNDSWTPPMQLDVLAGRVIDTALAGDAYGNAIVAWVQQDGSARRVYVSRYVAGGRWTVPGELHVGSGGVRTPTVALNTDGSALVLWQEGLSIWASRFSPTSSGGSWQHAEEVANGPINTFDLASAPDGDAFLVWNTSATNGAVFAKAFSAQARAWMPEVMLADSVPVAGQLIRHVRVAINTHGDAVATWVTPDGTDTRLVWASRYWAASDLWDPPQRIDSNPHPELHLVSPQVVLFDDGNAVAVWKSDEIIWGNRYSAANGSWDPITYTFVSGPGGSGRDSEHQMVHHASGEVYLIFGRLEWDPSYADSSPGQVLMSHFR